jgi:hypothetical protein
MRYIHDGNLPIDNNWMENRIRPVALGRSNCTVVGYSEGSLIGTLAARYITADGFVSIAGAGTGRGNSDEGPLRGFRTADSPSPPRLASTVRV